MIIATIDGFLIGVFGLIIVMHGLHNKKSNHSTKKNTVISCIFNTILSKFSLKWFIAFLFSTISYLVRNMLIEGVSKRVSMGFFYYSYYRFYRRYVIIYTQQK